MKRLLFILALVTLVPRLEVGSVESNENLHRIKFQNVRDVDLVNNVGNDETKSTKNKEGFEIKNFYVKEDYLCEDSIKKYETLVKTIDNYVHRYVSLFLIISNLKNHEITDLSEMIQADLELSITGEDLAFLQKYSKNESGPYYPFNLSKLNMIFSKIAKQKEKYFMEKAIESSKSIFLTLYEHPSVHHFMPFLMLLLITWLIYHFSSRKSFYIFITSILNSMIMWESLVTYWKKLKEADLELFVKALQSKGIPKECDPENLWWFNKARNYLFGDPCLQYYKDLNKTAAEEVSFFKCLIDTYAYYLVQTPFRVFGASVKDFSSEISRGLPYPFDALFYASTLPTMVLIFVMVILVLCGKRLKFAFFGSSIEVGDVKPGVPVVEKTSINAYNAQRGERDIKKLRPWTKPRLLRRMDVSSSRRRKLLLKASEDYYRTNNANNQVNDNLKIEKT